MRIRQVRPEFFADGRVSHLSVGTRLTYIGLWCIADDAGWLSWDVADIGAQLYPYESVRVRERRVQAAGDDLTAIGRLVMKPCGCAVIPTLEDHQKIGGNKSYVARDRHDKKCPKVASPDKSIHSRTSTPVGRYVGSEVGSAREATKEDEKSALLTAFRRQGLPVDVA